MAEEDKTNLDEMSVTELRERAAALEITGSSSMDKDELVQSVTDAEEQTTALDAQGSPADTSAEDEASESDDAPESHEASESDDDTESDDAPDSAGDTSDSSSDSSDDPENDAEGITAPSIGPDTQIEHVPPEERLDLDKISDVDAMGLDKRRQVGGKRYGASPAKQLAVYGGALAVIAALVFGGILLTNELDKAPPEGEVEPAPWADAEQKSPAPIDFPRSTEQ